MREEDIYTPGYLSTSRRPQSKRSKDEHVSDMFDEYNLTGEERDRRLMRRERNKVAAAKCRQRRVDQTNTLLNETEELEDEKNNLENEIQTLQQQKEQLEFLLKAHRPLCKRHLNGSRITIKSEPVDINDSMGNCHQLPHRPNSLQLINGSSNINSVGIPLSTPSSGIITLGLDSMVDGHTGLTPLTGMPVQCSNQNGSINTPSMNTTTLISL